MNEPTLIQIIGAALFGIAVLHTFSTKFFERLAHRQPRHAGIWHLLGEVEIVFGFWAMVLVLFMFATSGRAAATAYLESRNYTEPMFVFVIMVIAGTRPILQAAGALVRLMARWMPLPRGMAMYFLVLAFVPLLGSFITEPAAMTLAALMLRDTLLSQQVSGRLKYVTVGVLFVNISIGGTLTPFAAPPVLMVAAKWNWDIWFMLANFGWKAAIAVVINAAVRVAAFGIGCGVFGSHLDVHVEIGEGVPEIDAHFVNVFNVHFAFSTFEVGIGVIFPDLDGLVEQFDGFVGVFFIQRLPVQFFLVGILGNRTFRVAGVGGEFFRLFPADRQRFQPRAFGRVG